MGAETGHNVDAGGLANLNDIVLPPAVPWWPPAPAWYVVGALVVVCLLFLAGRWWRNRRRNRYRRQALVELAALRQSRDPEALGQLPALVKRAALAVWPRAEVASLHGDEWYRFLDESAGTDRFSTGAGAILERLAYRTKPAAPLTPSELKPALDAAEFWLKNHAARAGRG